jgi:phage-related protein
MSLLGLIRDVFEYVLHCFQKKSTSGIQTPKADMDLIHERFKVAQANAKGNTK